MTVQELKCNHCGKPATQLFVGYCEPCNLRPRCERCSRIREDDNARMCIRCQFEIDKLVNPKLNFADWKAKRDRKEALDKLFENLTPEEIANLTKVVKKK